jgi:predicted ATPase
LSTVSQLADVLGLLPEERAKLAVAARSGAGGAQRLQPPLLDGDPGSLDRLEPDRARWRLPSVVGPLIGRHAAVAELVQMLTGDRIVSLVGPGGVGKTRLALKVAEQALDKFPGGVCWVDLSPVTEPAVVPSVLLRSLGGNERPDVALSDQVGALLPGDPVLVVIDNCEQVIDAVATAIAALVANAGITVLATSREMLRVPGEVVWVVPPLSIPEVQSAPTIDSIADFDSVQLFMERANRVRRDYPFTDGDADAIGRICRRLDGIPLAIELTAARMHTMSAISLAIEVEDAIPLYAAPARGVPDRQTTLWASIDWSYRLLTDVERAAFRCLCCFVGPFTAQTFAGVAAIAHAVPEQSSGGVLDALASKSLVSVGSDGSYRVLDSIRAYAGTRAADNDEFSRIKDAQAEQMATWLSDLGAWEATDGILDEMDSQYANFRSALKWSIGRDSTSALRLVSGFGPGWHQLNRYRDAVEVGDEALKISDAEDRPGSARNRPDWARAVSAVAMSRLLAADFEFIAGPLPAAVDAARSEGDHLAEGWCRLVLGSRPPFDPAELLAAYELAGIAGSPMLSALTAASVAFGGVEPDNAEWLARAREHGDRLSNSSLQATRDLAQSNDCAERGRFEDALRLAMSTLLDATVMPVLRLVAVGHVVQVAFLRANIELAEQAMEMRNELSRIWPVGGWQFLEVNDLRVDWLLGRRPEFTAANSLHWTTRMGVTPSTVRAVCRAGIDRGECLDVTVVSKSSAQPSPGSLMAASLDSVLAAQSVMAGDLERARVRWAEALSTATSSGYIVLACDALEALGCLASLQDQGPYAAVLLASAAACREEIGYGFRFTAEQRAVDDAWRAVGGEGKTAEALTLDAAAELVVRL